MNAIPTTASVTLATLCALAMGVAIRRGATCTVAAVNQVVVERRFSRLLALGATAMVVLAGLWLAQAFHLLHGVPPGYAVTDRTVLGGVLLGFGASLNGACALGTIARIGAGNWSYVATPIGFYAGCRVGAQGLAAAAPRAAYEPLILHAHASAALLLAALTVVLAVCSLRARRAGPPHPLMRRAGLPDPLARRECGPAAQTPWSPHAASAVIGVTFVLLFVIDGAWTYTDVLADVARGRTGAFASRTLLLAALLLGAAASAIARAIRGSRSRRVPVKFARLARCLAGGALMGWASLMIPGGNDTLVLIAMPLLRPYAWVAFAAMCVAIGAAAAAGRMLGMWRQRVSGARA
jgi:uncharacterized membrane protein YedE/YeeE